MQERKRRVERHDEYIIATSQGEGVGVECFTKRGKKVWKVEWGRD